MTDIETRFEATVRDVLAACGPDAPWPTVAGALHDAADAIPDRIGPGAAVAMRLRCAAHHVTGRSAPG